MDDRYIVINDHEVMGPYCAAEAMELVDRGAGYLAPVSRVKHVNILFDKIARAVADLQPIVASLQAGLEWANGDYDRVEEETNEQ